MGASGDSGCNDCEYSTLQVLVVSTRLDAPGPGRKKGKTMARAKFYIRMDTYYQNARDVWYGPYTSKTSALAVLDASECARADLGQSPRDIKTQARCLGVYNTTASLKAGRAERNTISAQDWMPGTVDNLRSDENAYLYY